jgi:transcriptional regulator MraZ
MLLGEFRHSMDSKGRVFVPARWRDEFQEGIVLAQGLEHCVYIIPQGKFEDLATRLEELPVNRKTNRDYARLLLGTASEEQMDKQGRITLPQGLREWGRLDRDVVLTGVRSRGEIWDRKAWDTYKQSVENEYENIAEALEM